MMPGEAERKLRKLEQEHEETLRQLTVYKEFFEASLAMNMKAAGLTEAVRVREATNACAAENIRRRSALDAIKEMSKSDGSGAKKDLS